MVPAGTARLVATAPVPVAAMDLAAWVVAAVPAQMVSVAAAVPTSREVSAAAARHALAPKGKGRGLTAPARWRLYALGSLAVPLRRLIYRRSRPVQVLRAHHRTDLYGRV